MSTTCNNSLQVYTTQWPSGQYIEELTKILKHCYIPNIQMDLTITNQCSHLPLASHSQKSYIQYMYTYIIRYTNQDGRVIHTCVHKQVLVLCYISHHTSEAVPRDHPLASQLYHRNTGTPLDTGTRGTPYGTLDTPTASPDWGIGGWREGCGFESRPLSSAGCIGDEIGNSTESNSIPISGCV